jgi:hypothetical protein
MTTLLIKIQLTRSSVSAVTRAWAGLPGQRSLIPGEPRDCSLPHGDQADSGAHPSILYCTHFGNEGASSSVGDVPVTSSLQMYYVLFST